MTNYPDGTGADDPRAPWNQPDGHCAACEGCEEACKEEHVTCKYHDSDSEADYADMMYDLIREREMDNGAG